MTDVSHAKSKRKRRGFNASRRTARLDKRAQKRIDRALMTDYPVKRPKRDPKGYSGPYPKPGQTIMLCPTESKMMLFDFRPGDMLECDECGFRISREDAVGA